MTTSAQQCTVDGKGEGSRASSTELLWELLHARFKPGGDASQAETLRHLPTVIMMLL